MLPIYLTGFNIKNICSLTLFISYQVVYFQVNDYIISMEINSNKYII